MTTSNEFMDAFSTVLANNRDEYEEAWRQSQKPPVGVYSDTQFTAFIENALYDQLADHLGLEVQHKKRGKEYKYLDAVFWDPTDGDLTDDVLRVAIEHENKRSDIKGETAKLIRLSQALPVLIFYSTRSALASHLHSIAAAIDESDPAPSDFLVIWGEYETCPGYEFYALGRDGFQPAGSCLR